MYDVGFKRCNYHSPGTCLIQQNAVNKGHLGSMIFQKAKANPVLSACSKMTQIHLGDRVKLVLQRPNLTADGFDTDDEPVMMADEG